MIELLPQFGNSCQGAQRGLRTCRGPLDDLDAQILVIATAPKPPAYRPTNLAVAVACHLVAVGGDTPRHRCPRVNARAVLGMLLPKLPSLVLAELLPTLLTISAEPALSPGETNSSSARTPA